MNNASANLCIRRAGLGDVRTLAEQRALLHCEVSGQEWSADHVSAFIARCEGFFARSLADGQYVAWLIEEEGAIIGGGGALFRTALPGISLREEREVKIQSMYVLPEKRNRGAGRKLLMAILEYLRKEGVERINLSPADNARSFYEAFGFRDSPLMRF